MNRQPDPQRLIAAHEHALEFYRSHILDEPRALSYLRSRGIVAATAHTEPWTIGYAPPGWTVLRDHLRQAGFTDDESLAAGLVTTARNGNLIDVFRDRVMFPIRNPSGQLVAFTGRGLSDRPDTPKYRNSVTTAIYSKKHILYGLAEQLRGDAQPLAVMVVEGPADVVAVARLTVLLGNGDIGRPYAAVATCGTALTAEHVALLAATVPPGTPLISAFDGDTAGQSAIDQSYQLLRGWDGPVEAITFPGKFDPAALVAQGRAKAMAVMERCRRPLVDLVIDHRLARFRLDEIPGRLNALRAAAPLVADIASDTAHAARLSANLAARLDLNPLIVFEAVYPPDPDTAADHEPDPTGPPQPPTPSAGPAEAADQRTAIPLGAAGFPDPELVGHDYARTHPTAAAATWVEHDPTTGHSAWVITEGIGDTDADREAAQLAAAVAGRAAVLVGARTAVDIARTAVNAHFAQRGHAEQGNATIAVLTSFDGDSPQPGKGRFTVAWAGDARAYAATGRGAVGHQSARTPSWLHDGRWFAAVTVDHTLRGPATRAGAGALTASVRGGTIGVNRFDLPVSQIVLTGRALRDVDPDQIRQAVAGQTPAAAIAAVTTFGGPATVALVVRPRPDVARDAVTAARLAQQDRAPAAADPSRDRTGGPRATPGPQHRPALPAATAPSVPAH